MKKTKNTKKAITVLTAVLLTCLCLASIPGIVLAQQAGYEIDDFRATTEPTLDGKWSNSFEWSDAAEAQLIGDQNAIFRIKHDNELITSDIINFYLLIEVLGDTTNDPEDSIQICIAAAAEEGGTPVGGTTPQTDSVRLDWIGHDATGFTAFRGDGSGWVEDTGYNWPANIELIDSYDTSPLSATTHRIVEVKIGAAYFEINPEYWIRVAVYDASSGDSVWPPSGTHENRDVPDAWGLVETINDEIPEFPAWAILPLFAAATLSMIVLRKRLTKSGTQA
jgi:hypothetical protein